MSSGGVELDYATAARAFGHAYFNLIRRGANGSLKLSHDHWRLTEATDDAFCFAPREEDAPPLVVTREDIARIVWDRLPKQQVRSQLRFFLINGDVWTFSGQVDESVVC